MSDLQCATTLVLARHGAADYELDVWADAGGSLSRDGRTQAADLAARLAGRKIAHVYTSTLARAVQTGEIVAGRLGVAVTTHDGLREFGCGELAGTPMTTDPFREPYGRWLAGDLDLRIPGAESGHELVDRMRTTLTEVADLHRGETVLVVSHGGLLRLTLPLLARLGAAVPSQLGNCATVEIAIDADDWVVLSW
jgi:probable phosphoglycerate mutase